MMPSLAEHRRRDTEARAVVEALWPGRWRHVVADLLVARCWAAVCDVVATEPPGARRAGLVEEWADIARTHCRRTGR